MNKTRRQTETPKVSPLLEYITQQCWMMHLPVLQQFRDIAVRHARGVRLEGSEIKAIVEARRDPQVGRYEVHAASGCALIPVTGVIAKYSKMVNGVSQPEGTSVEEFSAMLDAALADPMVRAICPVFETPGGSGAGLPEMADRLWEASFTKPVVGFADDLCCSAGYYLASQCQRLFSTQGAYVGSIGTYAMIYDTSAAAKEMGIEMHIVRSGQHKGIGEDGVEVTAENLAMVKETIEAHQELFLKAVLRGRAEHGLSEEHLRELADGRYLVGAAAFDAKLTDGVATLEEVLAAPMPQPRKRPTSSSLSAAAKSTPKQQQEPAASAADNKNSLKGNAMSTKDSDAAPATPAIVDVAQVRKEAAQAEQQRITAINAALAGEALAAVRNKAITEGLTLDEAKSLAFDASQKAQAETLEKTQQDLALARTRLAAVAASGVATEAAPATPAASAAGGSPDGADPQLWQDCEKQIRAGSPGMTASRARQLAVARCPQSHAAYVEACRPSTMAGRN